MTCNRNTASWIVAFAAALGVTACATAPAEKRAAASELSAPPAPVYSLGDILGLKREGVDALLGRPALVRREGQGEYRRYGLKDCTLIVILYPDETGAAKARHVDATALTSEEEKPDVETCLAAG